METQENQLFAIVDCNNFYVSCERIFNPKLKQKPVVVLSNNDGCVVARSNEAKALDIPMGIPFFKVKHLIRQQGLVALSSNYALYGDLSERVMNIIADDHPQIEIYSIDEAFIDFTGTSVSEAIKQAQKLKTKVQQWVGIPISIGIAATKTLAKVANKKAKKEKQHQGVFHLGADKADEILQRTSVGDIWGIGRKINAYLGQHGVYKASEFTALPPHFVRKKLKVTGYRTYLELKGFSCIALDNSPSPKKSICSSRSFGEMLTEYTDLRDAVTTFCMRAAGKLKQQDGHASVVQVFIKTNRFRQDQKQYFNTHGICLPEATQDQSVLIKAAHECLNFIFRKGYAYKKAGVILSGIQQGGQIQLHLFNSANASQESAKQQKLQKTMEQINQKYRKNTLIYGGQLPAKNKADMSKSEHRSPNYVGKWEDLLTIHLGKFKK